MTTKEIKIGILKSGILFLMFMTISCSTSNRIKISNSEIETNFNKSLNNWNKLKKTHNNSYAYDVSFASWVGYRNTTKIVVRNGQLISREFLETQRDKKNRLTQSEIQVFKEEGDDINKNDKGFKGVLLDQVYDDCGNKSLQANEAENSIYFSVNEIGIVKSCGYAMKGCMDDCSTGVFVSNFVWLE